MTAFAAKEPLWSRRLLRPSASPGRTDGDGNTIHNRLLLELPRKECNFVFSKLVLVDLRLNDLLLEAGQPFEYCYFPNTAMASILNVMVDGKSVEVGLAG